MSDELEHLVELIATNKVIPIIGYDLVNFSAKGNISKNSELDVEFAENPDYDLFTKLSMLYNKNLSFEVLQESETAKSDNSSKSYEFGKIIRDGYDLFNKVYHKIEEGKQSTFHFKLQNRIKEFASYVEPIPSSFELLAKIKGFRFYINATIFNFIEYAVNTYKVSNLQNDNGINCNYDILNCKIVGEEKLIFNYDKAKHLSNPDKFSTEYFNKPCILNLFGTYDTKDNTIILENDMIELVANFFESNNKYEDLRFLLKDANLLFIGCDFPDWFLRFFIRFCVGEKLLKKNLVDRYIYEKLFDEKDFTKTFFLSNLGIRFFVEDPKELIENLFNELKKYPDCIEDEVSNNHYFFSYSHDDKEASEKILDQLEAMHINVWYDSDGLRVGDSFNEKIITAINNSCGVIPLITQNTYEKISDVRYYKKEWNHSVDIKKTLFPIRISGINDQTFLTTEAFSEKTIKYLLKEPQILAKIVDTPDFKLGEEFLIQLKNYQLRNYKQNS